MSFRLFEVAFHCEKPFILLMSAARARRLSARSHRDCSRPNVDSHAIRSFPAIAIIAARQTQTERMLHLQSAPTGLERREHARYDY